MVRFTCLLFAGISLHFCSDIHFAFYQLWTFGISTIGHKLTKLFVGTMIFRNFYDFDVILKAVHFDFLLINSSYDIFIL